MRRAAAELSFTPSRTGAGSASAELRDHRLDHPRHREPVLHLAGPRGRGRRLRRPGTRSCCATPTRTRARKPAYLEIAESEQMSGVILAAAGDPSAARGLVSRGRHVVAVDRAPERTRRRRRADRRPRRRLGWRPRTLVELGFRRIACSLARPTSRVPSAVARAGPMPWEPRGSPDRRRPSCLHHTDYRVDGGRAAMSDAAGSARPTRRRLRGQQPDRTGRAPGAARARSRPRRLRSGRSSAICRSPCPAQPGSSPSAHPADTSVRPPPGCCWSGSAGDDQLGPDRHAPRHVDVALNPAGSPSANRRPTMSPYAEYAERTIPGH